MSLLFIDGFDTGDIQKYDELVGCDFVVGRNGNGMRIINGGANRWRKQLRAVDEHATLIAGRAFNKSGGSAGDSSIWVGGGNAYGNLFSFLSDDGVTKHISVWRHNGNEIRVTRGGMDGVLLATFIVSPITYVDWYYIEVKCVLHDTTGSVQVKLNGLTIINLTNIDTKNGGTKAVFDSVGIGPSQTLNGVHDVADDLYICNGAGSYNNDFLGDVAVETLYPNANGTASDLVGSDGNSTDNYLLVDEPNTPGTTDYVESSTAGARDLYGLTNLARTNGPVYGVQVTDHVRNTDAGAISVKPTIKSGAVEADGDVFPVTTTWKTARHMWEQDPDGNVNWTIAKVNALEAGVEVV